MNTVSDLSGYVTLTPTLFWGVRWQRFNKTGAVCSILAANGVYSLALWDAGGMQAAMAASWLGFLPVMWAFLAGVAGAILGRYFGAPNPVPLHTPS